MEAKYFPIQIEEKWSKVWADRELAKPESENFFSQIIPPPNVTGTLHMGHSFQYAIMDFYTRYHHSYDDISVSYTHLTLPTNREV